MVAQQGVVPPQAGPEVQEPQVPKIVPAWDTTNVGTLPNLTGLSPEIILGTINQRQAMQDAFIKQMGGLNQDAAVQTQLLHSMGLADQTMDLNQRKHELDALHTSAIMDKIGLENELKQLEIQAAEQAALYGSVDPVKAAQIANYQSQIEKRNYEIAQIEQQRRIDAHIAQASPEALRSGAVDGPLLSRGRQPQGPKPITVNDLATVNLELEKLKKSGVYRSDLTEQEIIMAGNMLDRANVDLHQFSVPQETQDIWGNIKKSQQRVLLPLPKGQVPDAQTVREILSENGFKPGTPQFDHAFKYVMRKLSLRFGPAPAAPRRSSNPNQRTAVR